MSNFFLKETYCAIMDCSESFLLTAIRVAKEAEPAPPEAPPGWVPPCWQSPELFETPLWDCDLNTNLYGNIGCQVSKRGIFIFWQISTY